MNYIDLFKKTWKKILARLKKALESKNRDSAPPSKFHQARGFTGMDTQKELKDFQHKQQPTKPQVSEEDLSKVLEDVLQKPGGPDQGLYPGKKK